MTAIQVQAQNNATFARSLVLAMPGYALPLALSSTVYFVAQLRSTLDPTQAAFEQIWLTFDSRLGSISIVAEDTTAHTVTLALLAPAQAMAALDPANTYYADLLYLSGGNVAWLGALEFAVSQGATLGAVGPAPSFDSLASWPPLVDLAGADPATVLSVQMQGLPGPIPWAPAAPWAADTAYRSAAPASLVTVGLSTWLCVTPHTSGSAFDPTKWRPLVDAAGILAAAAAPAALAAALIALIQSLPTESTGSSPILWSDGGIPTYS